jgi:CRISPR-associated protein Csb2
MPFAIVAEFPLGTYRGHRPDGRLDPLPSPARLHAALLSAAGQGPRAEVSGDGLQPRAEDRAALTWLEAHAPDAISAPPSVHDAGHAMAYRAEGFFGIRDKRRVPASREDRLGSVALAEPVAWLWDDEPPPGVAGTLAELCRDVSHLGTAESPVALRVDMAAPTHRLDPEASLFSGDGLELEIPQPGRTSALERAYAATVGRLPSASADRASRAEGAVTSPVARSALALARYVALEAPPPAGPWPTVVLLPIDEYLPADTRLAWCVALHRALISRIGDGAPTLVTGRYEAGAPRPANRLAIQYVPSSIPGVPVFGTAGAFTLLVPDDADPEDLATLDRAVRALEDVRIGAHRSIRLRHGLRVVDGDAFWAPVPDGHVRVWVTGTAAVPESRPIRGRSWTIGDAALLSVGLVLRDRFDRPARRAAWYETLVSGVAGAGAAVLEAHKLNSADGRWYVHHVTTEAAVQPYRAALRLGRLVGERTVLAIGQSRHLGGGLLTPLDLPAGFLDAGAADETAR